MSPFAFTSMSMPITSVVGGDFILENPDYHTRRAAVCSRPTTREAEVFGGLDERSIS